jgi:hypothetical protein
LNFLEEFLWGLGEGGRRKRQAKWERKECSEGRHKMRTHDDMPSFYGRYVCCERWDCDFAVENPSYSEIKMEWWGRKARAEKKAKQAAGALVCAVKGHDWKTMPPPDWMSWCDRCGYCP